MSDSVLSTLKQASRQADGFYPEVNRIIEH